MSEDYVSHWRKHRRYGDFKPTLNEERRFYVYTLCAFVNEKWIPFYVGKGTKLRFVEHFKSLEKGEHPNRLLQHVYDQLTKDGVDIGTQQMGIQEPGDTKPQLTFEPVAYMIEEFWVRKLGRIDKGTGPLTNLTWGGPGCPGRVMSDEEIRKRSERKLQGLLRRGWSHHQLVKDKLSAALQRHWDTATDDWKAFHRKRVREGIAVAKRMAHE